MTANTRADVARAEVVGTLLRPAYLHAARQGASEGRVSDAVRHAAEDCAVRETIALQKAVGLVAQLARQVWG
jgi:5-methyltetrahydropteroyltriglutamate--homocysteine methyltransferase